jgi:[ribosomal protein S5]-alanine N-acetyltransferase
LIIQTLRLDLAPVDADDARAVLSGERLVGWASDYPTEGDFVVARMVVGNPGSLHNPYVPYKIRLRAPGLVIGGCGFLGPPDPAGSVEIGYGLAPSHRGQGLATEAVNGLIESAWKDPRVNLVIALTDKDNEPSQGVLRRAGFVQVDAGTEALRWECRREPLGP